MPSQEEMIRTIYEAISPKKKNKEEDTQERIDRYTANANRNKLKRLLKQKQ